MANNWCSTDVRVDQVNFTWNIHHFTFHQIKGDRLRSSAFSSVTNDAFEWFLELEFNNDETSDEGRTVSLWLSLSRHSKRKRVFAKYSFALKNKQKQREVIYDDIQEFNSTSNFKGCNLFDKNYDVQDYLTKDTLIIICNMELSEMNDVKSINRREVKVSECHLSEDFESLLISQEFVDVILSVESKDYLAHKSILAARSPVFAAMFRNEMIEAKQNHVVIEDIDEDVMGVMLKYIYTGRCENVDRLALELMAAADKYALDHLKITCYKALCKTLTVENASSVLVMADLHGMDDLKSEVIRFIVSKFAEILNTNTWKNILSSSPGLANEVCQAVARG